MSRKEYAGYCRTVGQREADEFQQRDTLQEIMDGWESRNPWATAQRLLDVAQDQRTILPEDMKRSLERSVDLHARMCEQERMQDVVEQGLSLERDVFLRKLREIEGLGKRSSWGAEFGPEDQEMLERVASILYQEEFPFVLEEEEKTKRKDSVQDGL